MPVVDLSLPELRDYRPEVAEPDDFDAFWASTVAEARTRPLALTSTRVDSRLRLLDVYDVSFAGWDGQRVSAWLSVPAGTRGPLPTVVQFHGYSGGRGHPHSAGVFALAGWAHLSMDTRGQGWSAGGGSVTADATAGGQPHVPGFLTLGITDPSTYYYRRLYTDVVRMLEAAAEHPLVDRRRIAVTGRSQGGGLALAAAGLAPMAGIDLVGVAPDVPFLCHFERAVRIAGDGPYLEIVTYLAAWRDHADAAYATLSYVDGVNLARRAEAPALFSVALMDPVCPPSTVFAAYHSYAADKEIVVYPHNAHEGGEDDQVSRQLDWLDERFTR